MSPKTKSLLYFTSFIIAALTYYNVAYTTAPNADAREMAKADIENTSVLPLTKEDIK